ncbi:hypothetical protein PoB_002871300 [Plakobranchus ocellatus]|uniref:Uncharacterized protein n=1 Tax=Plakobranchus ocellatus TaxID=259542 RepID=A0AAV4A669_9GAST|nr:hypothetical protein PoB_002871300 [Plakobranchus ocellatus]
MFDMQQKQPLPKLSVGEVFYPRQVWLYNLTLVRQNYTGSVNDVHIYTWLETESARGSNQFASPLFDYLSLLEKEFTEKGCGPSELQLFSDACASQNKNSTVLALLMNVAKRTKVFKIIRHFFSNKRPQLHGSE